MLFDAHWNMRFDTCDSVNCECGGGLIYVSLINKNDGLHHNEQKYYRYILRTSCSSSLWNARQVTSSVHPKRPCQACILCKQGNLSKYFHPKTWKNKVVLDQLRELEPSLDIQPDSCICRRCRDDISKLSQSNFIPRWRKQSKSHDHCYVPGCNLPSQKLTKQVSKEKLCNFFSVLEDKGVNTTPSDEPGYPLVYRPLWWTIQAP